MDVVEELKKILSWKRERSWVEYKVNWYEPNALGEYISALSNAVALEGELFAYFVWGIEDKTGKIVGTEFDYRIDVKNEPLEHYLARLVTPDTAFSFHEIVIEEKRLVVLRIPAAKNVPTSFDGIRYLRIGSSKVKLNRFPEREAELFAILRDGLPGICNTESMYQDLEFEKLFVYYASKGVRLSKRTFKQNLGLLMPNGKYNLLAQLVSDNSHIPIRFAIFNGTTKASTMYSVREFGNTCLLYSLEKVLEYGEVLNVPQADERNRVVERKEVLLFDDEVYREAIINAFVHNQWVTGNAPMLTVYSDRIEILSRGKIPPRQTLNGFYDGESVPVNQALSDMFLQLHISERTGRGVPKITGVYGKESYEFRENSIVVSIPFTRVRIDENTLDEEKIIYDEGEMPHDERKVTYDEKKMTYDEGKMTHDEEKMTYDKDRKIDTSNIKINRVKQILEFCIKPKCILEIGNEIGVKERKTVRRYIAPLLEEGRLAMTLPDKPKSKNQKYITIR